MRPTERDLMVARAMRDECWERWGEHNKEISITEFLESLPEPAEQGHYHDVAGDAASCCRPEDREPAEQEQAAQEAPRYTLREANQIARDARREGMIAGMEFCLALARPKSTAERVIRAEIERLKEES